MGNALRMKNGAHKTIKNYSSRILFSFVLLPNGDVLYPVIFGRFI